MKNLSLWLLTFLLPFGLFAQGESFETLALDDLSAFRPQAGNWSIVGGIAMHPEVDVRHQASPQPEPEATPARQRRKKRQKVALPVPAPVPQALSVTPGTGILLNQNDAQQKDHLLTSWEHGDIILDLELMIPKGSNSGLYLQGRYEVQLLDSWGRKEPSYSDIGGIYRNWSKTPGSIYRGKAPLTNAAKAPGTWQHLKIAFQAPRFDAAGKKTANARFRYVDLNGIRIHENLEVPLPTGGPISDEEVPYGPIMIQGDHGPVAFRNIRYQLLEEKPMHLEDIHFALYLGDFENLEDFSADTVQAQGQLPLLTAQMMPQRTAGRIVYTGQLVVPEAGTYSLQMICDGQMILEVGEQKFETPYRRSAETLAMVKLPAGKSAFRLLYSRRNARWPSHLGLFNYSGFAQPLHGPGSFLSSPRGGSPINVEVGDQPQFVRTFLDFEGDWQRRLTRTIAVGTPQGLHFFYDLATGMPVCVWRGEFLNATPMWRGRGNGSARPRGVRQYLFTDLAWAQLDGSGDAFALADESQFRSLGYRINRQSGLPVFRALLDGVEITDRLEPDETGRALVRSLQAKELPEAFAWYVQIAEGQKIKALEGGLYAVDQKYYIKPLEGAQLSVHQLDGKAVLMAPLASGTLQYTLIW